MTQTLIVTYRSGRVERHPCANERELKKLKQDLLAIPTVLTAEKDQTKK